MIIFGGAVGGKIYSNFLGGGLADDSLYVFDVRNGDE